MKTYKCLVCGTDNDLDKAHYCPSCNTPYELECWKYNNGCAVYACGQKLSLTERIKQSAKEHKSLLELTAWTTFILGSRIVASYLNLDPILSNQGTFISLFASSIFTLENSEENLNPSLERLIKNSYETKKLKEF